MKKSSQRRRTKAESGDSGTRRCSLVLQVFSLILELGVIFSLPAAVAESLPIRMLRAESLLGWTARTNDNAVRWESPIWRAGFLWNEAVPSWNVKAGSVWTIELRAIGINQPTTWFPLGTWCSDTNRATRSSWTGRLGDGGKVLTDTLRLELPAEGIQIRVTPGKGTFANDLQLIGVTLLDSQGKWPEPKAFTNAWGRELDVPIRSQADYPEGVNAWCSPTSVAMLLAWWSGQRGIPGAPIAVPEIAAGVFDPGWPGTGNWAFNMAFAGQIPGLRGTVARLAGISDLEHWIDAGLPVAASVSYALLKERPTPEPGDGHLVVVRGFTSTGDVLVNDPGVRMSRVKRIVPRAAFRAAWQHSRNTAYLVWPADQSPPEGGDGRW